MYIVKDLLNNQANREKARDSFIPHSKSLATAWGAQPKDQIEWGNQNVNALISLDQWLKERVTPPSAKKVYLAAAGLRKQIAQKLKGENDYAAGRFNSIQSSLHTTIIEGGRWGDQAQAGINLIVEHPEKGSDFERRPHVFYTTGYQDDERKQLLMVDHCQHYLTYREKKIQLACFRLYTWYNKDTKGFFDYFDISNCFNEDLDLVFDYIQNNQLNLWEENELSDDAFYEKLADLMWLLGQASPLERGSASTNEIILKLCLLRRFGSQAPLFFEPGLSIDLIAMLTPQHEFRIIFKKRLSNTACTSQEQIAAAYNLAPSKRAELYSRYAVHELMTHYNARKILQDNLAPIFWEKETLTLFAHLRNMNSEQIIKRATSGDLGSSPLCASIPPRPHSSEK